MLDIKKENPGIAFLNQFNPTLGDDVLQLVERSPELGPESKFLEIAQQTIVSGYHNYSHLNGYIPLRNKIAEFIDTAYSYKYSPKFEITITSGASQAISTAIACLISDGDEVIIFEPSYFIYAPMVLALGGRPLYVPLKLPNFYIDWDEVQKGITSRTKLIIFNTPHNPTGAIFSALDLEKLSKIVHGTNIQIISDESFNNMLFDGYAHQSIARYPKLAERSFLISSCGKFFEAEGWKVGFCAGPAKMMDDFRRFHHVFSFSVTHPLQVAMEDFFNHPTIYQGISAKFQKKRDFFISSLKNSRFKVVPSLGTYYQLLNYADISSVKDTEFVQELLVHKKIAVFPLSCFYHDGTDNRFIRICLAQPDETLLKAAEILCSI